MKCGDKIRILTKDLCSAPVKRGEILEVVAFEGDTIEAEDGNGDSWSFDLDQLGYGFVRVQERPQVDTRTRRRERIATAMLNGMLSHQSTIQAFKQESTRPYEMSKRALQYADALIAELDKK